MEPLPNPSAGSGIETLRERAPGRRSSQGPTATRRTGQYLGGFLLSTSAGPVGAPASSGTPPFLCHHSSSGGFEVSFWAPSFWAPSFWAPSFMGFAPRDPLGLAGAVGRAGFGLAAATAASMPLRGSSSSPQLPSPSSAASWNLYYKGSEQERGRVTVYGQFKGYKDHICIAPLSLILRHAMQHSSIVPQPLLLPLERVSQLLFKVSVAPKPQIHCFGNAGTCRVSRRRGGVQVRPHVSCVFGLAAAGFLCCGFLLEPLHPFTWLPLRLVLRLIILSPQASPGRRTTSPHDNTNTSPHDKTKDSHWARMHGSRQCHFWS